MLVYRVEKERYLTVFPPRGSFFSDGRWHRKGMWVVYTSESISLAKLETLANTGSKIPVNRWLRVIEIGDDAPTVKITSNDLPSNWTGTPYPKTLANHIRRIIDSGSFAAAIVPSVQSPRENNILLFPDFPDFNKYVREVEKVKAFFDPRLK